MEEINKAIDDILGVKKRKKLDEELNELHEPVVASISEAREARLAWNGTDASEAIALGASGLAAIGAFTVATTSESFAAAALYVAAAVSGLIFVVRSVIAVTRRKQVMASAVIAYRDTKSNALSHR